MSRSFSPAELEAYLDETLPVEMMVEVEEALRVDPQLGQTLIAIHSRRDAGIHTLGEIWRRNRLSCPPRQQLGSFLLAALPERLSQYVRFHLEVIRCRYCLANLEDLKSRQAQLTSEVDTRRRKYFQSSAGYLEKRSG